MSTLIVSCYILFKLNIYLCAILVDKRNYELCIQSRNLAVY